MEEKEIEEQRYGRNKDTQINLSYLEGGEFRRKFDLITDDRELNRLLYGLAKDMLKHRSGTLFEDMYWIDLEALAVVAKETSSTIPERIVYSDNTRKKILKYSGLITIHSHPMGMPPSIEDLNSNFFNNYGLGLVIGHNGKLFLYNSEEFISEKYYNMKVDSFISEGYNDYEANVMALRYCSSRFRIVVKEVGVDEL